MLRKSTANANTESHIISLIKTTKENNSEGLIKSPKNKHFWLGQLTQHTTDVQRATLQSVLRVSQKKKCLR